MPESTDLAQLEHTFGPMLSVGGYFTCRALEYVEADAGGFDALFALSTREGAPVVIIQLCMDSLSVPVLTLRWPNDRQTQTALPKVVNSPSADVMAEYGYAVARAMIEALVTGLEAPLREQVVRHLQQTGGRLTTPTPLQ